MAYTGMVWQFTDNKGFTHGITVGKIKKVVMTIDLEKIDTDEHTTVLIIMQDGTQYTVPASQLPDQDIKNWFKLHRLINRGRG